MTSTYSYQFIFKMSFSNKKPFNNQKPYCKVCHDAGKPESVYTSHYVKSRDNSNACPTLKATECRYCYKLGHITKFCPVFQKNKKVTDSIVVKKVTFAERKVTNAFDILSNESDDEDYPEEFPTLLKPETENKKWSDIIKHNKSWAEYSDSDSDEDEHEDKHYFKPICAVSITKSNKSRPMELF